MLLLINIILYLQKDAIENSNTSYVAINLVVIYAKILKSIDSNTSYVAINQQNIGLASGAIPIQIHRMLLLIVMLINICKSIPYSNTSYVAINLKIGDEFRFNHILFKYIVCCY